MTFWRRHFARVLPILGLACLILRADLSRAQGVIPVCQRSSQVKDLIVRTLAKPCEDITEGDLTGINELTVVGASHLTDGDFSGLSNLIKLEFLTTNFEGLESSGRNLLIDLPQLKVLNIDGRFGNTNGQKSFPVPAGFFDGLSSLTELRLSGLNGFVPKAADFLALKNLQDLELDDMGLTGFDVGLLKTNTKLKGLSLPRNQITQIDPRWLTEIPELMDLNLGENRISSLSVPLTRAQIRLHSLQLQSNLLTALSPSDLAVWESLTFLRIDMNPIAEYPAGFLKNLKNLQGLGIGGRESPPLVREHLEGLGNLRAIFAFDLSNSELERGLFDHTPKLISIILGGQKLELIPNDFFIDLADLRTVQVISGKLTRTTLRAFRGKFSTETLPPSFGIESESRGWGLN